VERIRLPWSTNSGRANRFYVTCLAVLAAVKSSPTRFELRNPLLPMIVKLLEGEARRSALLGDRGAFPAN
jgi:hypothetical protein